MLHEDDDNMVNCEYSSLQTSALSALETLEMRFNGHVGGCELSSRRKRISTECAIACRPIDFSDFFLSLCKFTLFEDFVSQIVRNLT